jgi:hypothetical protein
MRIAAIIGSPRMNTRFDFGVKSGSLVTKEFVAATAGSSTEQQCIGNQIDAGFYQV